MRAVHPLKYDFELSMREIHRTAARVLTKRIPPSSEVRWLRGLDSNQDNQLQRLACYQLHYPGIRYKSVADLSPICYLQRPPKIPEPRPAVCRRALDLLRC
jgi:hypothetical protein